MEHGPISTGYPFSFREEDVKHLADHLIHRHSIVLIGMKRVGISNFLRFFLNNREVAKTYFNDSKKHFFIPVYLNDLVECEIAPFWTLVLKRIVDYVDGSNVNEKTKNEIKDLFLESIQLQDLFFTIDSVRTSIKKISEQGYLPTLFFIRFDRLKDAVTPEFFVNLEGLRDASHQQLSYVFTSYLPFKKLFPVVFSQAMLSIPYRNVFIKPMGQKDAKFVLDAYKKHYDLELSKELEKELLYLSGGHFQYLQLGLILLHEPRKSIGTKEEIFKYLTSDERVRLQSEELWENLDKEKQGLLLKLIKNQEISANEKKSNEYLWVSGFVKTEHGKTVIFNPLFEYFVKQREKEETKENGAEFSKKELLFFEYLQKNKNQICERERIIEEVWPEAEELGISDWAIDKLAGRVRNKLKMRDNKLELQTIKTRGYKLAENT